MKEFFYFSFFQIVFFFFRAGKYTFRDTMKASFMNVLFMQRISTDDQGIPKRLT